jgi:4-hydroxybenzoate polyprenyltransferase
MIGRIRLLIVVIRPAVLLILGLFAAVALAQSGHGNDPYLLTRVLVVVVAFLVYSVTVNDIADEAIDRINLSGDARRPLVVGTATRRQLAVVAGTSAVVALIAAVTLTWPAVVVTVCGLLISTGYSMRPVRIADRGVIASLVLPACYVAVPFLIGALSVQPSLGGRQLELLGGLYLGFIGRIVLKDFRDVTGDALFGKRTFLVRHGRRPTLVFSAAFLTAGTGAIVAVDHPSLVWGGLYLALLAPTLAVLKALDDNEGRRRDDILISAAAILGRGTVMVLLMRLEMIGAGWSTFRSAAVGALFVVVTLGQARAMVRFGPRATLFVPTDPGWAPGEPPLGPDGFAALADPGQTVPEIVGPAGPAEVEPLGDVTAQALHDVGLGRRLDPFHDHVEDEGVGDADDRTQQRQSLVIRA